MRGDLLLAILDLRAQLLDAIAQRRGLGADALAVGDLALVVRVRLLELGLERLDLGVGLLRIELEAEIDQDLLLGVRRSRAAPAPAGAHRPAAPEHARVRRARIAPLRRTAAGIAGGPPYAAPRHRGRHRRTGHRRRTAVRHGCRRPAAGIAGGPPYGDAAPPAEPPKPPRLPPNAPPPRHLRRAAVRHLPAAAVRRGSRCGIAGGAPYGSPAEPRRRHLRRWSAAGGWAPSPIGAGCRTATARAGHPPAAAARLAALEHHRAALLRRRRAARRHRLRHDVDAALVDEADHERAALDHVGVTERLLLDPRVVEVRAVRAAEILDHEAAVLHAESASAGATPCRRRCGSRTRDHDRRRRSRSATARPFPRGPGCPGRGGVPLGTGWYRCRARRQYPDRASDSDDDRWTAPVGHR